MKKIVVAFDFSPVSSNAVYYATQLAKLQNAELIIANVMSPLEQIDNNIYNALYFPDYIEYKKELLESFVKKLVKKFPSIAATIRFELLSGSITGSILKFAKKEKVELIVSGSLGINESAEFIMGSTTASLVAKSEIPVLVIPPNIKKPSFKKMSFATDLNSRLLSSSKSVFMDFTAMTTAKVHVVHIAPKGKQPHPSKIEGLEQLLPSKKMELDVVHSDSTESAISNFVESIKSDFLILVKHEHSFLYKLLFTRHTKKILQNFDIPILILKD